MSLTNTLNWITLHLNNEWLSGGIGIHKRLKISRPIGFAGSSPASATKHPRG